MPVRLQCAIIAAVFMLALAAGAQTVVFREDQPLSGFDDSLEVFRTVAPANAPYLLEPGPREPASPPWLLVAIRGAAEADRTNTVRIEAKPGYTVERVRLRANGVSVMPTEVALPATVVVTAPAGGGEGTVEALDERGAPLGLLRVRALPVREVPVEVCFVWADTHEHGRHLDELWGLGRTNRLHDDAAGASAWPDDDPWERDPKLPAKVPLLDAAGQPALHAGWDPAGRIAVLAKAHALEVVLGTLNTVWERQAAVRFTLAQVCLVRLAGVHANPTTGAVATIGAPIPPDADLGRLIALENPAPTHLTIFLVNNLRVTVRGATSHRDGLCVGLVDGHRSVLLIDLFYGRRWGCNNCHAEPIRRPGVVFCPNCGHHSAGARVYAHEVGHFLGLWDMHDSLAGLSPSYPKD